jgi:hypothetical protein
VCIVQNYLSNPVSPGNFTYCTISSPATCIVNYTSNDLIGLAGVGVVSRNMATDLVVTPSTARPAALASADYSVIIVNNCANADLRMSVNGQVRINLNPI